MVDAHGRFCFLFFLSVVLAKSDGLVTLGRFVQDPLPVEPFNVTTTSPRLSVCFWNLRLHGLARTLLWTAEANLIEPLVKVATATDVVSLQGEYKLDGGSAILSFISVGGEGQFWMNATNVSTVATATFEQGPNGRPKVRDVDVRLELRNIKFHMENLMGGGRLARVGNSMLNKINGTIFKLAEESLHTTVRENIRQRINSELSRISVERSESLVDGLIARVGEQIRTMGADPFRIADQHHSFKQDLLFFTVHGEAHLTRGRLHGLSTVQRSGNLMAYYKDRTVTVHADLEFRQLSGTFRWRARVQGSRFSGRVSLTVSGVALHLKLTLPVGDNVTVAGPLHLEELELTDVGQVRLHLHGADSLDFLLEVLTNLIIDNIKQDLAHGVLELLEDAIRRKIATLQLSEFV
uniref:Putative hemolymph juvenile hormone binding protein n=1 Tax=Ixodes ricinus TaxID=34613 RepID=A0A147BXA6_IXORI